MKGYERFDPNNASPLRANSLIPPLMPAPTEEDTPISKSLDNDPPPEVDNGRQDTIAISVGSPAISTSTTVEAPSLAPDDGRTLNGVKCDPGMTSSPTTNSVYSLIQSSLLVIISST